VPEYRGIPIEQLEINGIRWNQEEAQHIRTRTQRYPERRELDVEPEWATEAALDPLRIAAPTTGLSLVVIGLSWSAPPRRDYERGRILKVWLQPEDLATGMWFGKSASDANEEDRKRYLRRRNEESSTE
jgi:hypothetical protein